MDRYQKVEKGLSHGEGAYGVVYKGRDKKNGDIVAMKVPRPSSTTASNKILMTVCHFRTLLR